ncbi:MAG: family 43 glycosylhydrolase [Segetibacter sp.]
MVKLSDDMLHFGEPVKDVKILDEAGKPLQATDHNRRFFEGGWMHKYNGKYYFSYSTGDTHLLAYSVGDNPYGPFTYKGVIMKPVQGWTTHHSIVEFKGKWYIFYHDTELSGKTHLRNIKVTELKRNADGTIETIDPYVR